MVACTVNLPAPPKLFSSSLVINNQAALLRLGSLIITMKILASWSSVAIVHGGVLEVLFTILLCYTLAVVNGHVPVWLPMISDCAVYSPEKYPFRLGIVIGAALLSVQAITTYFVNKDSSRLAKPMAVMAVVASAGLAVVGVVNEKEDNFVHTCKNKKQ